MSSAQDALARSKLISDELELKQHRIDELEYLLKSANKNLDIERNKNKNAALADLKHDVRFLQKKQSKLRQSVETWQTK